MGRENIKGEKWFLSQAGGFVPAVEN